MKRKRKMKRKTKEKGMTLISLIITIIAMSILAGIITSIMINIGIFIRTQKEESETRGTQVEEVEIQKIENNKYTVKMDVPALVTI